MLFRLLFFICYIFFEGFGLFISKGIVDLHHGEIRVFSKGEGTGCTFTVDLPMTRKMEPIAAVDHTQRRSTHDRIVGLSSGQTTHSRPASPAALILAPQDANNQANNHQAALDSLPPMDQHLTGPIVNDDPVSLSIRSSRTRIDLNLNNQEEIRSDGSGSVMSIGRQSLRDLAEHDMTMTSASGPAKATTHTMMHKQSTDRCSNSIHDPGRRDASGGGLTILPPILRGEHSRDDAVVATMGSDNAADPPSQQLQLDATTAVTSSLAPAPAQESALLLAPALSPSATPSRKSQKQPQNGQLPPQGPVYHVLVVDDSSMTRKMLMKTLRNRGLAHSLNTLGTSSHLPNTLITLSQRICSKHPLNPPSHTLYYPVNHRTHV